MLMRIIQSIHIYPLFIYIFLSFSTVVSASDFCFSFY